MPFELLRSHDHLTAVTRSSCAQHYLYAGYSSRISLRVALLATRWQNSVEIPIHTIHRGALPWLLALSIMAVGLKWQVHV
jgi:hypothetical protein